MLVYIRRTGKTRHEMSLDEPLKTDVNDEGSTLGEILSIGEDEVFRTIETVVDTRLLHEAISKLGEKEQLIVKMRFGFLDGHVSTQAEIAEILGTKQSVISRRERVILRRLKHYLLRAGFSA